jgi:hypothetical protein
VWCRNDPHVIPEHPVSFRRVATTSAPPGVLHRSRGLGLPGGASIASPRHSPGFRSPVRSRLTPGPWGLLPAIVPRRGLPPPLRSVFAVFHDLDGLLLPGPCDVFQPLTFLGFGSPLASRRPNVGSEDLTIRRCLRGMPWTSSWTVPPLDLLAQILGDTPRSGRGPGRYLVPLLRPATYRSPSLGGMLVCDRFARKRTPSRIRPARPSGRDASLERVCPFSTPDQHRRVTDGAGQVPRGDGPDGSVCTPGRTACRRLDRS